MVVLVDSKQATWASSASLVVAMTINGAVLPRYDEEPEVQLGLAGLLVVEALSTPGTTSSTADVADRVGVDAAEVERVLSELRQRRLLVDASAVGDAHGTDQRRPLDPRQRDVHFDEADLVVMPTPVLLRAHDGRFAVIDHDGRLRARLSAIELSAVAQFRMPITQATGFASHRAEAGAAALDDDAFGEVVQRAGVAGLVVLFDPNHAEGDKQARQADLMRDAMRRKAQVNAAFDRQEAEADAAGPPGRIPVIGVHTTWSSAPAGLGIIVAYARGYDDGRLAQHFDFRPRLLWDRQRLEQAAERPGVFLYSNYVWSTAENLELSALVKARNPESITIHGGPDTPKYRPDVERFFADNPHVDVAVHGEGEETFAELLDAIGHHGGPPASGLGALADVPGLSVRVGDEVVTSPKRDRIADVDSIPSPILMGIFDGFVPAGPVGGVALETNRGCPYGCTFCDWGSATLSRVRKFDLDRVFAELEWCARSQIDIVGICDANFGIFERDVEIAEKIAELKATYGYPRSIGNNYAKNTVKHLSKIIEIFTRAGIVAEGKMSMQSFDSETLSIIRRKNIKVEKYDALSVEFRRNELPLSVDLMLGLPGSTPAAFSNDLQACVDRDVRALIHPTMLLPNSPMNDPEYRAEHQIVAQPGEYVMQTASYTEDEWHQMHRLGAGLWLFENFGILRQVAGYVRAETGRREVDFYADLIEDADRDPERWPLTAVILRVLPNAMVPPESWSSFVDEIHRRVVEIDGVPDDTALQTVLAVQLALLPSRNRTFPVTVDLAHDYVTWRLALLEARDSGHRADWPEVLAPLRAAGPGSLTIDDPHQICTTALNGSLAAIVHESSWDFDSPVSRPRQRGVEGLGDDGAPFREPARSSA